MFRWTSRSRNLRLLEIVIPSVENIRDIISENVSFEIKAGQIAALVGHSGSGRSTCHRGYDFARWKGHSHWLQEPCLPDECPRQHHGRNERRDRSHPFIMKMVGEKGSTVSGDQRQRSAIARAVILLTYETRVFDAGEIKEVGTLIEQKRDSMNFL